MNSVTPPEGTSTYRCATCADPVLPPLEDLARVVAAAVAGKRGREVAAWWLPLTSWHVFQGDAVSWLLLGDLRCHWHAALLGAIVVDFMRRRGEPGAQLEAGG